MKSHKKDERLKLRHRASPTEVLRGEDIFAKVRLPEHLKTIPPRPREELSDDEFQELIESAWLPESKNPTGEEFEDPDDYFEEFEDPIYLVYESSFKENLRLLNIESNLDPCAHSFSLNFTLQELNDFIEQEKLFIEKATRILVEESYKDEFNKETKEKQKKEDLQISFAYVWLKRQLITAHIWIDIYKRLKEISELNRLGNYDEVPQRYKKLYHLCKQNTKKLSVSNVNVEDILSEIKYQLGAKVHARAIVITSYFGEPAPKKSPPSPRLFSSLSSSIVKPFHHPSVIRKVVDDQKQISSELQKFYDAKEEKRQPETNPHQNSVRQSGAIINIVKSDIDPEKEIISSCFVEHINEEKCYESEVVIGPSSCERYNLVCQALDKAAQENNLLQEEINSLQKATIEKIVLGFKKYEIGEAILDLANIQFDQGDFVDTLHENLLEEISEDLIISLANNLIELYAENCQKKLEISKDHDVLIPPDICFFTMARLYEAFLNDPFNADAIPTIKMGSDPQLIKAWILLLESRDASYVNESGLDEMSYTEEELDAIKKYVRKICPPPEENADNENAFQFSLNR